MPADLHVSSAVSCDVIKIRILNLLEASRKVGLKINFKKLSTVDIP